jgi:hypothetical protein
MKHRLLFSVLGLASCNVAGAASSGDGRACERAGSVASLKIGARLTNDGVVGGVAAPCADPRVQAFLPTLSAAVERAPERLLRGPVEVYLDPEVTNGAPLREIETHASGALLVSSKSPALRDESIVLHELFHVAVARKRPEGARLARVFQALEEGAADYFAASVMGKPEVGSVDGRETRRLTPRRTATELDWVATATGRVGPHALGHLLASELWDAWGPDAHRATLLAECLRAPANAAKSIPEFVQACAEHDRSFRRPFACWALLESECPRAFGGATSNP